MLPMNQVDPAGLRQTLLKVHRRLGPLKHIGSNYLEVYIWILYFGYFRI